eukprot:5857150-Ditylum_brightwellii.AAC.1
MPTFLPTRRMWHPAPRSSGRPHSRTWQRQHQHGMMVLCQTQWIQWQSNMDSISLLSHTQSSGRMRYNILPTALHTDKKRNYISPTSNSVGQRLYLLS